MFIYWKLMIYRNNYVLAFDKFENFVKAITVMLSIEN